MSSIKIQKIGITKLAVDCIVNAANAHLLAGGGVCGAIFKEAGYSELQKACDKIGHCDTGNAVITPAFKLPSKYIIHAVGPVWNGGNNNENQLLYSCYQSSMQQALENNCHSIAFPLISSGIYGYPKKEAWEVALSAVSDFQKANENYSLDVIFAVLDDNIYELGQSVLSGIKCNSAANSVVRFHLITEPNAYLSNWFIRDFVINGKKYCCVEQYMMEQKALIFGDSEIAAQIMQTSDQSTIKALGRQVKNFNSKIWNGMKQLIVYKAVLAKFSQNFDLAEQLISTGNAPLAECAINDKVWGIGLGMDDNNVDDINAWNGEKLLGFVLQAVRDELKTR